VAAQVDADASEGELIIAYCRLLLDYPQIAQAMGQQARDYVAREHTLDQAALGYMRFLAQRYGWDEPQKIRQQPLWNIESEAEPVASLIAPNKTQSQQTEQTSRPASQLEQQVAQALASMGVREDDQQLLQATARAIATIQS
jgi:hypothetical protein